MSSGWAAQTASMPSSSSVRPPFVARLRRIHVPALWPSRFAAFGASHGACRGTLRARRFSRRCAPVLGGADPLPAHLDHVAITYVVVLHAPADALTRLHDHDRRAARAQ